MEIHFFETPEALSAWFASNHASESELWVGFWKKETKRASVTWPQSVEAALAFGWIDGVRKSLDESSYKIRFTPRKGKSIWSAVNIGIAERLIAAGKMSPAGLAAFEARQENRSGIYSYEQRGVTLDEPYASELAKNAKASEFFAAQPASYKKAALWWVVSAKKEETRAKRLAELIARSARAERIPQFVSPKARSKS
jgi:uncharacterized protein YdeI (YjbR/CyaY-like superfamily)